MTFEVVGSWPEPHIWQRLLGAHAQTVIDDVYREIPRWIKAGRPYDEKPVRRGRPPKSKTRAKVVVIMPPAPKRSRSERDELIELLLSDGLDIEEIKRRLNDVR